MEMDRSIERREFLKAAGCSMLALHSISTGWSGESKPNVILILADDLGYGDISGFGTADSGYTTPNLIRMADEGAKLTQVYVPVPYCAPSRATLLTGRYPFRNGVVHNPTPDAGINKIGLPSSEITIAEVLKQSGYATGCIGKWHLGHVPGFLPREQGFDEYFGILYSNDMRPVQLIENEEVVEYPVVQATLTKRYTQRALDFIERSHHKGTPFFLYLPHAMPHKPLAASEEFYTPETPEDLYADVIRELDWSLGQILSQLKDLGIDENTLVIFTSDNGPWYGGSTGGLRGMKGKTWDGGLRVPLIARWPGMIPAGIVNPSVVGTVDLFPTIAALCGARVPGDRKIDGKNIWPVITSSTAESPHEAIFAMQGPNLAVVRSGKWKLHIQNPGGVPARGDDWIDPRGPDGVTLLAPYEQARPSAYPGSPEGDKPKAMMLFDMENDPAEQHDVSETNGEVVKRLKTFADAILNEMPSFSPPEREQYDRPLTGGKLRFWEP